MSELNKILQRRIFEKDVEIDWDIDFDCIALNLSTMQFENVSYITEKSTLYLNMFHSCADFSEEISDKAKSDNADYLIYTKNHFCVGYLIWHKPCNS